jgi:hypothetical protein
MMVSCVDIERLEKEGDWIWELGVGGWGAETCWLTIMVTTPLELIRGVMLTVTPELSPLTWLANTELPPVVTPDAACEVSTGT